MPLKGSKRPPFSEEWRRNLSIAHKGQKCWATGKKLSEEHKKKLSVAHKGKKCPWNKESKHLFKKGHTLNQGIKHPQWKGGVAYGENRKKYYRLKALERIARKHNAKGTHTLGEWEHLKALYQWTCPRCWRKEPKIKLTEDHIVPLIKGGSNEIENIQPLCLLCNSKKATKIIKFRNVYGKK